MTDAAHFAEPDKELPDLGWSRLVTGPLSAGTVPGNHLRMIRPPHVAALTDAIEEALAPSR